MKRALLVIAALLIATSAQAQLAPPIQQEFFNSAGTGPAANGFLCTTQSGGTVSQLTYQDQALTSANQNPVRLNAAGRPVNGSNEVAVFLQPLVYRMSVYAAGTGNSCNGTTVGALLKQVDGVNGTQNTTRAIYNQTPVIVNTGAPVTVTVGTAAVTVQFPASTDSSIVVPRFQMPPDTKASQSITLTFGYNADSGPGTTNTKFTFKIACTRNGAANAYTTTDTITATNDTLPHTFTGTNTVCSSVSAGDLLSIVVYRVTGGTNDATVAIDLEPIGFTYTSTQ